MPIINSVITQGGIQPTGTKNITANGTHDVADYEYADVAVPTTAPDYYAEFEITSDKNLQHSTTSSHIMNFKDVKTISSYTMVYLYRNNTQISGNIDMGNLINLDGSYCCQYAFGGCTGITGIDLHSLKTIHGGYTAQGMFSGCTSLTNVDLTSLVSIGSNYYSAGSMFYGCTNLTSINFPSLRVIKGTYGADSMFYNCTGITNVDLSSLLMINGSQNARAMFSGCTSLTNIDFSSLTYISGLSTSASMFSGCTSLTSVNFPRLSKISNSNQLMSSMFYNCTSLTELSFPKLAYTTTNFNTAFSSMLSGCKDVTVHFPQEWETTMSTWSNITNGMGGTNTAILYDLPNITTLDLSHIEYLDEYTSFNNFGSNNYFSNITSINLCNLTSITGYMTCYQAFTSYSSHLTSVDLSNLTIINGQSAASYMFYNCTGLTSIDLSNLITLSSQSVAEYMFAGCTNLSSVDLSSLIAFDGYSYNNMFEGCTSLTNVNLSSLAKVTSNVPRLFKNCTSLTNLSFPSLKQIFGGAFSSILDGVTGCTVHFPSNMSNIPCGGTNTTILYDLPATNTLTGADINIYSRNPKYDTATALAWKIGDYGTTNFTPYYTSGTTDPVVGDTIYSDAACTTAVTTISSIA